MNMIVCVHENVRYYISILNISQMNLYTRLFFIFVFFYDRYFDFDVNFDSFIRTLGHGSWSLWKEETILRRMHRFILRFAEFLPLHLIKQKKNRRRDPNFPRPDLPRPTIFQGRNILNI